jgi:hypothetical protein
LIDSAPTGRGQISRTSLTSLAAWSERGTWSGVAEIWRASRLWSRASFTLAGFSAEPRFKTSGACRWILAMAATCGRFTERLSRFYDSHIGAWRSTWIDPLNGRVRRFIGRTEGGLVILDGLDEDPRERWSFRDITTDSFLWRGESSTDGAQSWFVEDEMLARRRQAT